MNNRQQKDKLSIFNDLRSYSRHWVKEFIESYKSEVCLWQTKHPDYNNHILRNQGYDKLVEKLKEVETNPDRSMVVRKINSLRSAFRREFRKKCVRADYEPRLWYYHDLAFIADQQFVLKRGKDQSHHERQKKQLFSENFDEDDTDQQNEDQEEMSMQAYDDGSGDLNIKQEQHGRVLTISSNEEEPETINDMTDIHSQRERGEAQLVTIQSNHREHETQQAVNSITSPTQQAVPVHTIQLQATRDSYDGVHHDKDNQLKVMGLYKPDCIPMLNTSMVKHEDEYDAIGINVASKLRSMSHHQRIICEKLISDVLFSGQLESLTVSSKLVL